MTMPGWTPSLSRISLGSVICPFDVTFALIMFRYSLEGVAILAAFVRNRPSLSTVMKAPPVPVVAAHLKISPEMQYCRITASQLN